jgi:hypothetical protein
MHDRNHYAVKEHIVSKRTIKVYNGLNRPFTNYKDHIALILKKCMLIELEETNIEVSFLASINAPLGSSRRQTAHARHCILKHMAINSQCVFCWGDIEFQVIIDLPVVDEPTPAKGPCKRKGQANQW